MKKGIIFQIAVFLLSLSLLSALYTFMIIPKVKASEENKYNIALQNQTQSYVSVLVYTGKTPLLQGSIITEVNETNFTVKNIPAFCLVDNYISDFKSIVNKQLKYTIISGQQISKDIITEANLAYDGNDCLKEFKVKSLVGGHAVKGAYVDILARYPDGSYEVIVPETQLYDILSTTDKEGNTEYMQGPDGFYTIVLAVDEEEFKGLTTALLLGYLDLRVCLDNSKVENIIYDNFHI
jgi:hypothetical protein